MLKEKFIDRLVSRKEAAKILDVQMETLAAWKSQGKQALPVIKIGSRAKYRLSDIMKYIESRTTNYQTSKEGK